MDKGHKEEIAYSGGMGLTLGERRPIYPLEWDIALEQAPDRTTCSGFMRPSKTKREAPLGGNDLTRVPGDAGQRRSAC